MKTGITVRYGNPIFGTKTKTFPNTKLAKKFIKKFNSKKYLNPMKAWRE